MKFAFLAVALAAALAHLVQPAAARDNLLIVSSASSLRFTKAVAERVARTAGAPAPVVEPAGPDLAFAFLCAGPGEQHPDAVSVPRRMTKAEFDICNANRVGDIVEIPVGLDILVLAQSRAGPEMQLTLVQMYYALTRQFLDEYGDVTPNPNRKWAEINAQFPDDRIDIRIPPRSSGTREAVQELFLVKAARSIPEMARMWPKGRMPRAVRTLRDDPPFVVAHENEEAVVRELLAHPRALGVISYARFRAAGEKLRGVPVDGVAPTLENAYAGRYPGTRTVYLYLRKGRTDAVRGLDRLGAEYLSNAALGPGGYLLEMGYMPLAVEDLIKGMELVGTLPPVRRELLPD